MSAASRGTEPLSAAELAVMRQLMGVPYRHSRRSGSRWQLLADVARDAGLTVAAAALAIRRLHYALGYVVPIDPAADDTTSGAWALSTLGEARLLREPPQLDVAGAV